MSGRIGARLACGAAVVLALADCGPPPPDRASPQPNLLLITIDTLRADRLSAWGYGSPTSPTLDRLAASGARFSWALSAASCTAPSHASILTGLFPSFHSVGGFNGHHPLTGDAVTLAELLAAAGYSTAAVVSNPVLARRLGLDQGFGSYDDELGEIEANREWKEQSAGVAARKARAALARLEPPWFFWLHLQDPHGPYSPPSDAPELPLGAAGEPGRVVLPVGSENSGYGAIPLYQQLGDERRVAAYSQRYDREIAYADRELGRFLAALEADGELEGALIAVTADHGEAMGEDGFWFAHGHSLGLDQVRVPLILATDGTEVGGRTLPAGRVIAAPVSHAALFATLLEAAGLSAPQSPAAAPRRVGSLWPLLAAEPGRAAGEPVFVESLNQVGVAAGGWYLRRDRVSAADSDFWAAPNPTTGGFWKPLGTDWQAMGRGREQAPGSLQALLDAFQRRADVAAAEEARRRAARPAAERLQPPDEEELRRLRALGYAG